MDELTLNNGCCRLKMKGCRRNSALKLSTFDWLSDLPESEKQCNYVEVQFKNTRKGYYLNSENIPLEKGDMVAVEAQPGHDIGEVTLTGNLVLLQMRKVKINQEQQELKKIYRKAKEGDLEKMAEAKSKEQATMIKARQLAEQLQLSMKIGDVEYQGDGTKAIFYYIADERVDFRQLIKVFAETFRVRIEMKQIGARQEAGRIGGTGPCGRELCCASWMSSFNSVTTNAARIQDISLNPQKLAGQCAKLKCCMNYEVDTYQDALRKFPDRGTPLETLDATFYHFKSDILRGEITYSSDPRIPANLVTISAEEARNVIKMNRSAEKPMSLGEHKTSVAPESKIDYENVVGQDSLTRFDNLSKRPNKRKPSLKKRGNHAINGGADTREAREPLPKSETAPNNSPAKEALPNAGNRNNRNRRQRQGPRNNKPNEQ